MEIESVHELSDLKPNSIGEKNLFFWKKFTLRLFNNFSKNLLINVRKIIGRQFSGSLRSPFLKNGITLALFTHYHTLHSSKQKLRAFIKYFSIIAEQNFKISLVSLS